MAEWHTVLLGEVVTFQRGYDLPHRARKTGNIPIVSSAGVIDYHSVSKVDPPGVITGRYGTIGEIFLIKEPFWPLNTTLYVRDFHGNDPCFVYYLLQRFDFASFSGKSGVPGVNRNDLHAETIMLPPKITEQRAIAAALSDVDAMLGALDQLIAKKRGLKQAAMQKLLTGQTRLPGFHGEWKLKLLGEVTTLIPGGVYGEEKPLDSLIPSRVATTAHIEMNDTWNNKEMNVRFFSREQVDRYSPIEGDLIVVKSSGSAASIQSGKIGFVDENQVGQFVFSNFLMLLRPAGILPKFLYFYLCSNNVKKLLPTLVEASTYPNIRIPEYLALEIPFPPSKEQNAIAAVLMDMDAELAALEQRRNKTHTLKQAMMQELLTGRIRLI